MDVGFLDFPEHSQFTKLLSDSHTTDELLARVSALENLRTDLETNVQEILAF